MSWSQLTTVLKKMTLRLTAIWCYGAANADEVAQKAAQRIDLYLRDGDFQVLEKHDYSREASLLHTRMEGVSRSPESRPPIGFLLGAGPRPLPIYRGDTLTFGRDPKQTVFVEDALASRRHAAIECGVDGSVTLRDLGSRNSTFLNHQDIGAAGSMPLHSSDTIRIGGKLYYFLANAPNLEPRAITFQAVQQFDCVDTIDSGHYFKDGKVISKGSAGTSGRATGIRSAVRETGRMTPPPPEEAALSGNLRDQSLPQVLQYLHASGMTGELTVKGEKQQGSMAFEDGQLFFAESGECYGADAVYECAQERTGAFHFKTLAAPPHYPKNIVEPTLQVILESCRRIDEGALAAEKCA